MRESARSSSPAPPGLGSWCSVTDEETCRFAPDLASLGAARRFARAAAGRWGVDPTDVALIVGELAANAVVHGHTPFTVSLARHNHRVSIEVTDESASAVRRSAVSLDSQNGRGLLIVERLATAWGIRPAPTGGKVVWAELDD